MFKTYHEVNDGQEIQMGNEGRSKVLGKGTIELFFTSEKKIVLVNALHVPNMNRNLVSGDLLGKPRIKSVYEAGRLILSHNGVFIWKGFSYDIMIKLCIVESPTNNKNNDVSAYMIDFVSLWHNRLAHIGIMKRMIKCGLISYDNINNFDKCEICVKSKIVKKPFHMLKEILNY